MKITVRNPEADPGAYWRNRYLELSGNHEKMKTSYDKLRARWETLTGDERKNAEYAQMVCQTIVEEAQR